VDFAVLLPERDLAGAQQWLADLQERVDASEALRAANLSMGQGLAECLVDDTADELLLRADAALRRPA
jgi:GGDEF domain-containing protein